MSIRNKVAGKPYFNSELVNEGILNESVREKRFSDAVLGSWAMTELQVDGIFQLALGITDPQKDKRIMIVHDYRLQFGDKLRFVKQAGAITEDEYKKINSFNNFRNALLHTKKGKVAWFFTISPKEKEEVIMSAWDAAHASFTAMIRLIESFRTANVASLIPKLDSTKNQA